MSDNTTADGVFIDESASNLTDVDWDIMKQNQGLDDEETNGIVDSDLVVDMARVEKEAGL